MRKGFSLIELSIVLVILGLLTGGILAGKSLIRASELRSVSSDLNRYKTAVTAFRDKYFGLPGDLTNATSFWGAADGSTGLTSACTQSMTPATSTATCNGNGDGFVGAIVSGSSCSLGYEQFRAWQHLANAGLIEGTYSGVYEPGNTTAAYPCRAAIAGSNIPASRIGGGFVLRGMNASSPSQWGAITNRFYFGTPSVISGVSTELTNPIITTEEAWNLDTKMDDGTPFNGAVTTYINSSYGSGTCVTSSAQTATYDFTQTGNQCMLAIKLGM